MTDMASKSRKFRNQNLFHLLLENHFLKKTSVSGDYQDDTWGNSKMFSSTD